MDYHGRIMNIETDPARIADVDGTHPCTAYKFGHRDARHAAAEIANEADAEIARLREALGRLLCATEGFAVDIVAKQKARAALGDAP